MVVRHRDSGGRGDNVVDRLVSAPLVDTLTAAEEAVRGARAVGELRVVEVWLRELLSEVLTRLGEGGGAGCGSGGVHGCTPSPRDGAGAAGAAGSPSLGLPREGSGGPDALEEWYTDPWAYAVAGASTNAGGSGEGLGGGRGCSSSRKRIASSGSSDATPSHKRSPKNLVEMFSLEQLDDDCRTEAEEATALCDTFAEECDFAAGGVADLADHPHWQYGRCVAAKLVACSPRGCGIFEQLLVVLMTVFDLPKMHQKRLLESRRHADHGWLSFNLRCAGVRADNPA